MLSELRVAELLVAIGERTPAPASGAATALTAALGASLAELASRYAGDEVLAARAHEIAAELVELGDDDAVAYTAFMAARTDETRRHIVEIPERIAVLADEARAIALAAAGRVSPSVAGDAHAAAELAGAAARVARSLAELNAATGPGRRSRSRPPAV
jgi:formiminotetrahydrofolate cyclodeaminase